MTSLTTNFEPPKRGEIWLVNFDPTVGSEIKKIRPAIVISSDAAGKLPIKLVAPITDWKPYFAKNFWHVKIELDTEIGLTKASAIDALQLRGMDLQRFIRKLGNISDAKMLEITAAILTIIEYEI
ncbi:type II toxin-antitoxin system PemK/MazF family toxin [Pseudanabaena cinerea]|uniref:type II toxin-antitoxin system PemK/MazF family toxin n=1 Tax=Pseudanabaena cinerea TaxID=2661616 RepID=UPI003899C34A